MGVIQCLCTKDPDIDMIMWKSGWHWHDYVKEASALAINKCFCQEFCFFFPPLLPWIAQLVHPHWVPSALYRKCPELTFIHLCGAWCDASVQIYEACIELTKLPNDAWMQLRPGGINPPHMISWGSIIGQGFRWCYWITDFGQSTEIFNPISSHTASQVIHPHCGVTLTMRIFPRYGSKKIL